MGVDPSPLPGSPCDGRMHGSRRVEFAVMRLLGRILAGLAILVVLLLIGVVVAATALGRETLVPPVAARIKALTGREFTVNGTARVALALPPRVELTDIALGNAPWASSPKMIEAKELGLTVEILPLLSGRFELSRIAKWKPSKLQPFATHSFRIRSSSSSATLLVSTTLYWSATKLPRPIVRARGAPRRPSLRR